MEKSRVIDVYRNNTDRYGAIVEDHFDSVWDDILNELNISDNYKILDLGCGTGKTINRIMNKHKQHALDFTGIDLCLEMIAKAKERLEKNETNGHQIILHAEDCLDYLKSCEENKYHLVIASFFLAYVEAAKLFPLVNKTLKEEGKFIILTTSGDPSITNYEKDFLKFAVSHFFCFNWWTFLITKRHLVPPIETIIKLLAGASFSIIKADKLMIKIPFKDPLSFFKWMDESGFAAGFFDVVKKSKKEFLLNEAMHYLEEKNITFMGEPLKNGKPFTFNWPIYKIIAEK